MPASPFSFSDPRLIAPASTVEAGELLRANPSRPVLVAGGGTAWDAGHRAFLAAHPDTLLLSTANLAGILEYDPGELTVTACAGTRLADIEVELSRHGQYLPFDPPFVAMGATLGGVVAAGLSGSRRMRYGGLRDFVLGIEFLNSRGERVRSGGKVVKNSAGYDFPKLFCGSMGALGVLIQVSVKVFPAPSSGYTLLVGLPDAAAVQKAFRVLQYATVEISAADSWTAGTLPDGPDLGTPYTVAVLVEGLANSLEGRIEAIRNLVPTGSAMHIREPEAQAALWATLRDVTWIGDAETVLRCVLAPGNVSALDAVLREVQAQRVYTAAGNAAWAAFSGSPLRIAAQLAQANVSAHVWRSPAAAPDILPEQPGQAMVNRVKRAFDPANTFYRAAAVG